MPDPKQSKLFALAIDIYVNKVNSLNFWGLQPLMESAHKSVHHLCILFDCVRPLAKG